MSSAKINKWQVDRFIARLDELAKPFRARMNKEIEALTDEIDKPTYFTADDVINTLRDNFIHKFQTKALGDRNTNIKVESIKKKTQWGTVQVDAVFIKVPACTVDLMQQTGFAARNKRLAIAYHKKCKKVRINCEQAKTLERLDAIHQQMVDEVSFSGAWYAKDALIRFQDQINNY